MSFFVNNHKIIPPYISIGCLYQPRKLDYNNLRLWESGDLFVTGGVQIGVVNLRCGCHRHRPLDRPLNIILGLEFELLKLLSFKLRSYQKATKLSS